MKERIDSVKLWLCKYLSLSSSVFRIKVNMLCNEFFFSFTFCLMISCRWLEISVTTVALVLGHSNQLQYKGISIAFWKQVFAVQKREK